MNLDDFRRGLRRRMKKLGLDEAAIAAALDKHPRTIQRALDGERTSQTLRLIDEHLRQHESA